MAGEDAEEEDQEVLEETFAAAARALGTGGKEETVSPTSPDGALGAEPAQARPFRVNKQKMARTDPYAAMPGDVSQPVPRDASRGPGSE